MKASDDAIVVRHTYDAPAADVWDAITDPARMCRWFFEAIREFRPEPGFETKFDVENDGTVYRHWWNVEEVVPGERIVYRWRYEGVAGDSDVTWELAKTSGGTELTLTHRVREDFPEDDPAFARQSCVGGWEYFLGERLPAFLAGVRS